MLTILTKGSKIPASPLVPRTKDRMTRRHQGTIFAVLWTLALAAACSPGVGQDVGIPVPLSNPSATSTHEAASPTPRGIGVTPTGSTSRTASAAVAATSRGPELEATDPEQVALDSGGLQLVEFFRFT